MSDDHNYTPQDPPSNVLTAEDFEDDITEQLPPFPNPPSAPSAKKEKKPTAAFLTITIDDLNSARVENLSRLNALEVRKIWI